MDASSENHSVYNCKYCKSSNNIAPMMQILLDLV